MSARRQEVGGVFRRRAPAQPPHRLIDADGHNIEAICRNAVGR
jgi:hypothetical protein